MWNVRVLLTVAVGVILYISSFYALFWGQGGLREYATTEHEFIQLKKTFEVKKREFEQMTKLKSLLVHNQYYQEKYAREKLQMAREGEVVVLIPQGTDLTQSVTLKKWSSL